MDPAIQAERIYNILQMEKFLFGLSLKFPERLHRIQKTKNINVKDQEGQNILFPIVHR